MAGAPFRRRGVELAASMAHSLVVGAAQHFGDLTQQLVGVEGAHDERVDPGLPREHSVARLLRDEHDAHAGDVGGHRRSDRVEQLQVLPDASRGHVEHDTVDAADTELTERLLRVVGSLHAMSGVREQPAQQLARAFVVVDDQDLGRPGLEGGRSLRMLGLRRSPQHSLLLG